MDVYSLLACFRIPSDREHLNIMEYCTVLYCTVL